MKIEVITSFHKPYFDLVGKDCIESWIKYWPKEIDFTCYVEDFEMPNYNEIKQIPFSKLDTEYFNFQNKEYKLGTKKFSKKAFSFIHAMEHSNADRIIWVDADTVTLKPIPMPFLKLILPDDKLSTHMGVHYDTRKDGSKGNWFVPETGFFSINTNHNLFPEFRKIYKSTYVNGDFNDLRRQYDNDVYGYGITKLNAPCNDLCSHFLKPYKTPLKHTVLGEYLFHFKAKHSKESIALTKSVSIDLIDD